MNEEAIIRTVPAAGALHKVPGFDPLKHLRKAVNGSGEQVQSLALRYKRLWFRLVYPSGRLLLNPLRVTDQMAIFEAQVFFRMEDPTPASSFTATKSAKESRGYIRAAQDEALNVALDNAGFGIQLCDVTKEPDAGTHSPDSPQPRTDAAPQSEPRDVIRPVKPIQPTPASKPAPAPAVKVAPASPIQAVEATEAPVEQPAKPMKPTAAQFQAAPEPERKEAAPSDPLAEMATEVRSGNSAQDAGQAAPSVIVNFPAPQEEPANVVAPEESGEPAVSAEPIQAAPSYTEDMSVEEIAERMTVDDAKGLRVDFGTCKGWTMGQVMENRPSSLKFFVTPFCECGNILKAAATLLLQELNQQKAS